MKNQGNETAADVSLKQVFEKLQQISLFSKDAADQLKIYCREQSDQPPNISKLTNSRFGSQHWFNSLLGRVLRMGEFLEKHELTPDQRKNYGSKIQQISRELMEHFSDIQNF